MHPTIGCYVASAQITAHHQPARAGRPGRQASLLSQASTHPAANAQPLASTNPDQAF